MERNIDSVSSCPRFCLSQKVIFAQAVLTPVNVNHGHKHIVNPCWYQNVHISASPT